MNIRHEFHKETPVYSLQECNSRAENGKKTRMDLCLYENWDIFWSFSHWQFVLALVLLPEIWVLGPLTLWGRDWPRQEPQLDNCAKPLQTSILNFVSIWLLVLDAPTSVIHQQPPTNVILWWGSEEEWGVVMGSLLTLNFKLDPY